MTFLEATERLVSEAEEHLPPFTYLRIESTPGWEDSPIPLVVVVVGLQQEAGA